MILGLILGVITVSVYGDDGVYSFQLDGFEVFMLVESERDGNAGILVGADQAILERYIPATGFRHTANAFLIKTPRQNILIDTGTGTGDIIVEKIKKLGVQPNRIDAVLITHLHGDHFGGLVKDGKAVYPNAKIYLSSKELEHFTKTSVNQGAVAALEPYKSEIITFEPNALSTERKQSILHGIFPIAAYGHTPGHTIYQIESGRAKILIIGDLLHVALVQFHVPAISATFDIDPGAAAKTRHEVLSYAAKNRMPIGGMHIVYPGIGFVEEYNNGNSFNYSSVLE